MARAKPKQHKHIYHRRGAYEIQKSTNGKNKYYGRYANISDAMDARDKLIANNWIVHKTPEEEYLDSQKNYYRRVYLSSNKTRYCVQNKVKNYIATVDTIEEALYLRDLYYDEDIEISSSIENMDLTKNNPYLKKGLDYPLPERLILHPPRSKGYGFGFIRKRNNHYRLERNGKYYASCVTYEQAYFYYQELNKRGWDKKNLPGIRDDYPEWYTWLNRFYIYISPDNQDTRYNWKISLTPSNNLDGKLENIGYVNIEDALHERDFLVKHDWNYDLLVECIDDNNNPYYDMELPPYPERKIRNLFLENDHDKELAIMRDYIYEHADVNRKEMGEFMGITDVTIGNWLKKYDSDWRCFKKLCLQGKDPLDYISMPRHIYTPDLSPKKPKHFKNYVIKNKISKTSPYKIVKDSVQYGVYPTWEIANKVSNELQRIGWSQENRKKLQKKYNVASKPRNKRNVYKTKNGRYCVRKRFKQSSTNYGAYDTWLEAAIVRELLAINNWDKNDLPDIQTEAKKYYNIILSLQSNMFGGQGVCTYK